LKIEEYVQELNERKKIKRRGSIQAMCMMFPRVKKVRSLKNEGGL